MHSFAFFIGKGAALAFVLYMLGCTAKSNSDLPPANADTTRSKPPKKWLALGDSYTIGQGVQPGERFAFQSTQWLNSEGYHFAEPQYMAVSGWSTGSLLQAIKTSQPAADFDIVSLLIGVNNQYQGRSLSEYRTEFLECLQQALLVVGNRPERVWVLSIPDYSVTPFARRFDRGKVSREIDDFNAVNKLISDSAGVHWVEITQGSRLAATDKTLLCADSLHYSGREYARWAEKLVASVKKTVKP